MGNSSSSTVHVGHAPIASKWAPVEQDGHHRSRMNRAYFPPSNNFLVSPRTPTNHPLLVQPQHLVLPSKVSKKDLKLKSTENGKILMHGGTISGRRLNELDLSTGSECSSLVRGSNLGSGRSTPNLVAAVAAEAVKSGRRRDSEPDSSVINPSIPTGKCGRVKGRKKSSAPLPPSQAAAGAVEQKGTTLITEGIRLASYEQRNPSSREPPKKERLFRTKNEGRPSSSSSSKQREEDTSLELDLKRERTTILELKTPAVVTPLLGASKPSRDRVSKPSSRPPQSSSSRRPPPPEEASAPLNGSHTKTDNPSSSDEDLPPNTEVQKRTFYFGMEEEGTVNTMRVRCQNSNKMSAELQRSSPSRSAGTEQQSKTASKNDRDKRAADLRDSQMKSNEKRPSSRESQQRVNSPLRDVKSERLLCARSQPSQRSADNRHGESVAKERPGQGPSQPRPPPPIHPNSDSDHHTRQDSGTFEDYSKSSLSSSELDIPAVLLRPVLPIKKQELPRFSPSSAWRALDSPPGRSLSSEEGYHPVLQQNRNERSGDSGISAGDSPAVPEAVVPLVKCWTPEQDLDESSTEEEEHPELDTSFFNLEYKTAKPSLRRIHQRSKHHTGLGNANWFLSKSEPNSLNNLRMMSAGFGSSAPVNFMLNTREVSQRSPADGWESEEDATRSMGEFHSNVSDIGYGPSSLPYKSYGRGWRRPFSRNSIYLPDSSTRQQRGKAKSVENLSLVCKPSKYDPSIVLLEEPYVLEPQQQQLPTTSNFADAARRKKFKFQSTLRVLERKMIEKRLAMEAEEREMERLRELERMREVEEEFERKRQQQSVAAVVRVVPWQGNRESSNSRIFVDNPAARSQTPAGPSAVLSGGTTVLSIVNSHSPLLGKSSNSSSGGSSHTSAPLGNHQKRLEPEGAPSSSTVDLRRELIHASRRRNGTSQTSDPALQTQELSEYRQEARQYWDYCSRESGVKVRVGGGAPSSSSRYGGDSSSELLSNSRASSSHLGGRQGRRAPPAAYRHPEVVCEIPAGRAGGGSSRHSGSASNLLLLPGDDRSSLHSGPSSLISDNYRREWAQQKTTAGGSSVIQITGPSRASSSLSLQQNPTAAAHTPEPYNNDGDYEQESHSLITTGGGAQNYRHPAELHQPTTFNSSALQPRPYHGAGKSREFRPVVFRPSAAASYQ